LSDLERDWGRQREKLATELSRHESFLTGKEDQINRRVVEFEKLVVERTSAIEAIVERARGIEKALEGLRDAAQGSANTIAGLIGSVQADANIVRAAREQTTEITNTIRENAEKVVAARRDAEGHGTECAGPKTS